MLRTTYIENHVNRNRYFFNCMRVDHKKVSEQKSLPSKINVLESQEIRVGRFAKALGITRGDISHYETS